MITDSIHNIEQYRGLNSNLDTAIDFLKNCDLKALTDGKTVIDQDRVFINVMEADLRTADGAEYEYHKRYADLQIDIDGSEYWEWMSDAGMKKPFDETADFGSADGTMQCAGVLGDGKFVLFLPNEFHKPSCISDTCTHVRKAVIKIKMS